MFLLAAPGLIELIFVFIVLAAILLPVICLIDIVRSRFSDPSGKLVWVLIVLFLPYLGSILYLAIGRTQKAA